MSKSSVGSNIDADNGQWTFEGNVASKFDEHVSKSVPLYHEGQWLIQNLSEFFLKEGSICYDIGSSTGGVFSKIIATNAGKMAKLIGIEPVGNMVKEARRKHSRYRNISYINKDVLGVNLKPADLIISYYTIQFIQPSIRQNIFNRIFECLNWGGGLILFEKVRAPDARFQDINTSLYTEFKLKNNFTPEEIFNKTRSLKGVLEPFSSKGNLELMERAGFKDIMTICKFGPFEGFLAIK